MPTQPSTDSRTRRIRRVALSLLATALVVSTGAAMAAGLPPLTDVQPIVIHYGVNEVPAFTRQGIGALVVMVHRENGNAHSSDGLLIAVHGKSSAPGVAGIPQEVDREDAGAAGTTGSGLYEIEPFDGENEISALRLVRATLAGRPETLLLQAKRQVADSTRLTSPTSVELKVWRLEGPSDDIGRTPYRFVLAGQSTTDTRYCNATTALAKELGVPFPDGWDNEDTPDGCLSTASQNRLQTALDIERRLDVTSFANSFGPRHLPAGTTFQAAGFDTVESFPDGWVQVRPHDASWQFSLYVIDDGADHKQVCIGDQSLSGGTYRTMQAIDIALDSQGRWRATGKPHPAMGCSP